jgi:hypothetical protein
MPEPSPEQKLNPETLTSGDSNFESATGSPAPEDLLREGLKLKPKESNELNLSNTLREGLRQPWRTQPASQI